MFLANPSALKHNGVLGMNKRNIDYIGRYNPRKYYKRVDDKLTTKQLALANNIAVPDLIGTVSEQHEIADIPAMVNDKDGFVIKPSKGSGGKGFWLSLKSNMVVTTSQMVKKSRLQKSIGMYQTCSVGYFLLVESQMSPLLRA